MHRCYPECKPSIGYHYSKSESDAHNSLQKHVNNLEKELQKAKDAEGLVPNPSNYVIKDVLEYGDYKVVLVRYPNCTNYDGNKCLIAKCTMLELIKLKRLDPHFTEVVPLDGIQIVARFPPSDDGVEMTKTFAQILQQGR